jgi:hypothetical protein
VDKIPQEPENILRKRDELIVEHLSPQGVTGRLSDGHIRICSGELLEQEVSS